MLLKFESHYVQQISVRYASEIWDSLKSPSKKRISYEGLNEIRICRLVS